MKPLALYLRSRAVPASAAVALGCAAALWALSLAIDNPQGRSLAALLAALAATAAIAPGLAVPDHDLDRTAAIAWPPRRAAHILVAGAVLAALLVATSLGGAQMAGAAQLADASLAGTAAAQLVRNVAGLVGLVALGAVVLGAPRAPLLPVAWTVPALWWAPPMGEPPTRPAYKVMLTWMVQPADTSTATVTAIALAIAGILAYALAGSRR